MSSKTKLVSMALLGSILIVTALLLILDPGSPPVSSEPQSGQDVADRGLQSDQDPEIPAQAEIPAVAEREALVAPESETATSNISGRILFESRVSIVGAEVLAYRGTPTDKKGGFSNLMGNLAQIGSSSGANEIVLRLTGEPLARAEVRVDGSFSLEGIRERHVRLAMEHDFYGLKQVEPVHIPAGETEVDVGALESYLGAHVIGQVVGPGRDDNALVHIAAEPDPMAVMRDPDGFLSMILGVGSLETRTDGDGRFEFRAMWPSPHP